MLGERRKYLSKINCEYLSSISCVTFDNENFHKMNPTRVYRISSNRPCPRKECTGGLVSSEIKRALEYTTQDVIMYTCTQSCPQIYTS